MSDFTRILKINNDPDLRSTSFAAPSNTLTLDFKKIEFNVADQEETAFTITVAQESVFAVNSIDGDTIDLGNNVLTGVATSDVNIIENSSHAVNVAMLDGVQTVLTERDDALQINIDQESAARSSFDAGLQNDINTEVSARIAGDAALQAGLDAEIAARTAGDAALQGGLDAEVSARTAGDADLQVKLDAEATARNDDDDALQANIDAEATARNDADDALQANIDTEAAARVELSSFRQDLFSAAVSQINDNFTFDVVDENDNLDARVSTVEAEGRTGLMTKQVTLTLSNVLTCESVICRSDIRLKENIKDMDVEQTLKNIAKVKSYTYNFKKDETKQNRWGFIAQELKDTTLDHLVNGEETEDKYLGINYTDMIAVLPALVKKVLALEKKLSEM